MPLRQGFWPVLALVVLGHGAVLTLPTATPAPAGASVGAAAPPLVFQVRPLLQPAAVAQAETVAGPPLAAEPTTTPPPTIEAVAPTPEALPVTPPAPRAEADASQAPSDLPYHPRADLSAAARPLGPVDVPFPDAVKGRVALAVQITLFIDAQGAVQRVRIDTPDVHPAFAQSIQASFLQARFQPGEIDAAPVRSQLRLEVEFASDGKGRRGG